MAGNGWCILKDHPLKIYNASNNGGKKDGPTVVINIELNSQIILCSIMLAWLDGIIVLDQIPG
jgi:hypothetical protein